MRVLLADDDDGVREALRRALILEGYAVDVAADGDEALRCINVSPPDIALLDWRMPEVDGLEVCRRLRVMGENLPVLMLTARDGVGDRVEGLDAGADDYLVKPFALEELLARIRALLRRVGSSGGEVLRFADLELDTGTCEARRGSRSIDLTRTEFLLLELFLRNPRRVLPRATVYDRVWGYDFGPNSNAIEVYIGYLRRKLELDGEPRLIQTVRGLGYALRTPR
jgi:two-component system, OmpR family, response regulator MprA